jgi:DNA-binding transcriptional LysR family regulator
MAELPTATLREVLADLPYLLAVAETGGVTAAADELAVPQPTVSRGLARLAARLDVPLLVRHGRGVRLSAEATELLPYAERALAAVDAGVEAVRRRAGERAEAVAITFQHTLGRAVVPALVRAVLERRPHASFALHQGSRDMCVEALLTGAADAVLLAPAYRAERRVETIELYAEPLVLAVPPGHRLARRRRVRLRELVGERLLAMRPEFGLRALVDQLLVEAGVEAEIGFEGEDVQTLRGLVAAGLGVAVLPPAVVAPADVVEVPLGDAHAERRIGISWRTDRVATPAAEAMLAVVRDGRWWGAARARSTGSRLSRTR